MATEATETEPLLTSSQAADIAQADDNAPQRLPSKREEGLRRIGFVLGGVRDDYFRRSKHYFSDWTDAVSMKTLSASLFMFVATFTSTLALGNHISHATKGKIGITEYLLMNGFGGVLYSIISCQPLVVLRPTGPITLVIEKLYLLSQERQYDFYPFFAWTGIFVGVYMGVIAAFELSRFSRLTTPFTEDVFAFFVCSIYVYDGLHDIWLQWSELHMGKYGECLMFMNYSIGIVALAIWLSGAAQSRFFTRTIRTLLVDYALFLAILAAVLLARLTHSADFPVFFMEAPKHAGPTTQREWLTSLDGIGPDAIGLAAIMAFPISLFFYVDQNISSILTQKPEMKLQKGSYFHSSFLCLGFLNAAGPLLGLPFVTGSLPHSPQFVVALSDIDHETMTTISVCENRIAPWLTYAMLMAPLLVPTILAVVPQAAVSATLIYVGFEGMHGTQLYERLLLMPADPNLYPKDAKYAKAPFWKMHFYTAFQILCWAGCWIFSGLLGLFFPLWVACLVPFRQYLLPCFFTSDELKLLDSQIGDNEDLTAQDDIEADSDQKGRNPCCQRTSRRFSKAYERP
eukprot:TRINITY_DN51809_c0_g1_i1.p1 TRINITY_DN51809_c0_g1~~TRINITY_DN51809_c0_g1_i1.p1  ORF type:complete len:571 (+),score=54.40 TRINITY_DN51809_c0_g1_i1:111-1823(+)